jgi:uncharacterized protein (TIGR02145 family)
MRSRRTVFVAFGLAAILATQVGPVTSFAGPGQAGADAGTFRDPRDGQVYPWVRIGDQIWMAENLRLATEAGSWCWEDNEAECESRGRFYDWETAQRVAPPGWHLPSDEEWKVLERALGLTADQIEETGIERGGPANTVAAALKKRGAWPTEYEGNPIEITDETGFSAIPSGLFGLGEFSHEGYTGWWTSTASGDQAWIRVLGFFNNKLTRDLNSKAHAYPVRCVKDSAR